MKMFFILWCLCLGAFAQDTVELKMDVLVRDDNFHPIVKEETLRYLYNVNDFEGRYFKIVLGKNDTPISIHDADEELVFKAATTYFHLHKARDFFVNTMNSDYVRGLPQLTIRLDITNVFNELGHFANDNQKKQYNNALSIPPGKDFADPTKTWGREIWFSPLKVVDISELKVKDNGMQFYDRLLQTYRTQNQMTSITKFLGTVGNYELYDRGQLDGPTLFPLVGSFLMVELVYKYQKPLTKLFSRKKFWLETALVPEIIYHEFSHIALSDYLELYLSTAVIEGMADYFAGTIADSAFLATQIKQYNTFSGKKAYNKTKFSIQFETTDYANGDFVFGLLWSLKDILGDEALANKFLYTLRTKINTNSSIRGELIDGLLKTCDEICPNPTSDRLKILMMLNEKGI